MNSVAPLSTRDPGAPHPGVTSQPGSTATVADITVRRRPPRSRPVVMWEPAWLPRYRALKQRVENRCDARDRDLLLLVRRLIARSRFTDVRALLEREALATDRFLALDRSA